MKLALVGLSSMIRQFVAEGTQTMQNNYYGSAAEVEEFAVIPGRRTRTHEEWTVYMAVRKEAFLLSERWAMFTQLFATKETFKLLGDTAPQFTTACHFAFLDASVLSICRLNDPASQSQKKGVLNNSFRRLYDFLGNDDEGNALRESLETRKKSFEFATVYRNKQIAHADYATYIDITATTGVTRIEIAKAIIIIGEIINDYEDYYKTARTDVTSAANGADADKLLTVLAATASDRSSAQNSI